MSAETLRKWIRQAEVDQGQAPGVTGEAPPRQSRQAEPGAVANLN